MVAVVLGILACALTFLLDTTYGGSPGLLITNTLLGIIAGLLWKITGQRRPPG
ncbi:hypothetical protein PM3016_2708 [Paenibacillus mucilaginosus 3016]|uniref:Uncharacterized protein n=3 Tax=Paenibacillus mucilaginosus TaxID=61624 RepID=H6NHJ1_9BACL|nr:hypothetical protein KNP414_02449 [Paenibacillus mucilaginosus KNP414]AFC29588.1 hypothetical protein PM3016_2708 [Paenibacillus mucilaginosus 3016]